MSEEAMKFVADFVKHYDTIGIYDEFDNQTNKMVTSRKIYELVKQARELMPKKLPPREAGVAMSELSEENREKLIADAGNTVINLRTEFAKRTAMNGGIRQVLVDLVQAVNDSDDHAQDEAFQRASILARLETNQRVEDEELSTQV